MYGNQNQYQQQNNFQQPQQAASPVEMSLDSVMQGGSPGLFDKNDPVGTSHQGEITGIEAQQQTEFQTGAPLFYPNGNPKPQVVIHLKTGLRATERNYDDGVRVFYCKGYSIPNLRAASQQAGVGNFPRVGDTIRITFSETKPSQTRGFADAKIYSFQITPGNPNKAGLEQAMSDQYAGQQPNAMPQTTQGYAPAPQQPAQAASQPVTAQQATQILQLKAIGKTPQDIAGMMGLTLEQVLAVGQSSQQGGQQPEPEL